MCGAELRVVFELLLITCSGFLMYTISFSYELTGSLLCALECSREALRLWRVSHPPGHRNIEDAVDRVHKLERSLGYVLM